MSHPFFRFVPHATVALLMVVSGVLMVSAARNDSVVVDELAHIPSGYTYVRFLDYRLNPEHPPLLKALSALPLLALDLNFPTDDERWVSGLNEQWGLGTKFLYESGNNPDEIVFLARLAPILLTLLLIILIFVWASELVGRWWALLPTFLFALSPNVIAHGHLVTTDLAATFGVVLSTYLFLRYLMQPSGKRLVAAGIGFGIAELLKFSLVLLIPFFFLLALHPWVTAFLRHPGPNAARRYADTKSLLRKQVGAFLSVVGIGFLLVYLLYAVFITNYPMEKQLSDTLTIFENHEPRWPIDATTWMIQHPLTRPIAHYLSGLFVVLSHLVSGHLVYFFSVVSENGWWFYFPL
ncbi:MAG: glycosyltransferase family 39 protein, partial [Patescibacteria group bacterium]